MKRKILALLLSGVLAVSLTACSLTGDVSESSAEESLPVTLDPSSPEYALDELLRGAQSWDTAIIESRVSDNLIISDSVPAPIVKTASDIFGRMTYRLGACSASGNLATVELDITAVKAEKAFNDAVGNAVGQIAKQSLLGDGEVDYATIIKDAVGAIDVATLDMDTDSATAYMIRDSDGYWQLNASDERNLPFINALSGGALNMVERIAKLADSYNIRY